MTATMGIGESNSKNSDLDVGQGRSGSEVESHEATH